MGDKEPRDAAVPKAVHPPVRPTSWADSKDSALLVASAPLGMLRRPLALTVALALRFPS